MKPFFAFSFASNTLLSIFYHSSTHRAHIRHVHRNILATVFNEPALQKLLIFHMPNLISLFRCLDRARESVHFRGPCTYFATNIMFYSGGAVSPRPIPKLEGHSCRLSATAYSIYSQLPSIPGGHLLYPQPEVAPCRGDKAPT
jgi:hypothetical protein